MDSVYESVIHCTCAKYLGWRKTVYDTTFLPGMAFSYVRISCFLSCSLYKAAMKLKQTSIGGKIVTQGEGSLKNYHNATLSTICSTSGVLLTTPCTGHITGTRASLDHTIPLQFSTLYVRCIMFLSPFIDQHLFTILCILYHFIN